MTKDMNKGCSFCATTCATCGTKVCVSDTQGVDCPDFELGSINKFCFNCGRELK